MPALNGLEQEEVTAAPDSNFQRFCAAHGILSVEDFLLHDVYALVALAEREVNSEELKQGINQVLAFIDTQHKPWLNGLELLEDARQNKHLLPTGCQGLDLLLKGGLLEGQLTELVGASSCGKTQICLLAASNVTYKHMSSVVYLDTCNSFSPKRVAYFIGVLNPTLKQVRCGILERIMANILCKSVFNIFELFDTLDQLQTKLRDQARSSDHKVRLLVIDSISSVIAPILGGNMAYGRSLMISAGFLLKRIAYEHNLSVLVILVSSAYKELINKCIGGCLDENVAACVVTNHMVGGNVGSLKPALGESWKGVAHTRLLLSRVNRTNKCSISVLKHPSMARGNSVDFLIPEENF
ncbi:hypothetical protein Syun_001380 [Stephania yunnanensis]|uniref:RecA family profile 1 domain-containing protein n=1 Tax=Stephania yunnanensis TaxID=152371 RepID=A0AAP0Q6E8_9MAGN